MRAHLAQRHDDVPRLERAGRRLGQQRRVEHRVLRADDRGAALAEQTGDVGAGEAAAEHERAAARARLSRIGHSGCSRPPPGSASDTLTPTVLI